MIYWDSSAIVPLLVDEAASDVRRRHLEEDPEILTWWGNRVECVSALGRLVRDGLLAEEGFDSAVAALEDLAAGWTEILPTERLRRRAMRLLRLHPLCAADALQLASALVGSGENPSSLAFAGADPRLNDAARREGFRILA